MFTIILVTLVESKITRGYENKIQAVNVQKVLLTTTNKAMEIIK